MEQKLLPVEWNGNRLCCKDHYIAYYLFNKGLYYAYISATEMEIEPKKTEANIKQAIEEEFGIITTDKLVNREET